VRIDLNADLGEGIGDDEAMLAIVSSASIATGAHAGGGAVLARAVAAAAGQAVAIGAHPSYRDRVGFGRASHLEVLHRDPSARSHLVADLVRQILVVAREAERHGRTLAHVKAHGSLYNEAVRDPVAAMVVSEAVLGAEQELGHGIALMTQPGGELARIAADRGMAVIHEGFADRGYLRTGQLVPREQPGAIHEALDAMVAQALDLAAARAIRAALESRGWQVASAGPRPDGSSNVRGAAAGSRRSAVAVPKTPHPDGEVAGRPDGPVRILPFGDRAILLESTGSPMPGTAWVLHLAGRAWSAFDPEPPDRDPLRRSGPARRRPDPRPAGRRGGAPPHGRNLDGGRHRVLPGFRLPDHLRPHVRGGGPTRGPTPADSGGIRGPGCRDVRDLPLIDPWRVAAHRLHDRHALRQRGGAAQPPGSR
jgi:UPF0271 protein